MISECKDRSLTAARARFAYREVADWSANLRKKATPRVRGLPVQVRTQGLQVTVAALLRDDKAEVRYLVDLLAKWLLRDSPRHPFGSAATTGATDPRALLAACVAADRSDYLAARAEAIAFLDQVKLYADALDSEEAQRS